jgi:hypothetical protein
LLFPLVNQNWSIPDKSRYFFFLLPACYIAMATLAVDVGTWLRKRKIFRAGSRSLFFWVPVSLVCLMVVLYPLWPLWTFYQKYQDSEWSTRSILRTTEVLRQYREQSIPIYIDADIRHSQLPIVGSNLLKSLEYLLFLDGTASRVVWFDPDEKPPRTFNHEVEYIPPTELEEPSVWVLSRDTQAELSEQYGISWSELAGVGWSDERFGLYQLGTVSQ